MSQVMTANLTAVLADIVNNRIDLEAVLKRWQSVAKQEDQLESEDKALVSQHLQGLLAMRDELIEMAKPHPSKVSELGEALLGLEFRLKDALYTLNTYTKRSSKTDFMKLRTDVDTVYVDLHKAIEDMLRPSDLMGYPQVAESESTIQFGERRIVSIQVQTTQLTGGGVQVVPFRDSEISTGLKATHWSLYTRDQFGIAQWVEDIKIDRDEHAGHKFSEAMVKAAKLSMEHGAFIEQVK
jgi:hypothetical protein